MKAVGLLRFGKIAVFITKASYVENIFEGEILVIERDSVKSYGETQYTNWDGDARAAAMRAGIATIRGLCEAREAPDFWLWLAESFGSEALQEAQTRIAAARGFGSSLDEACGIADLEVSHDITQLTAMGLDWEELEKEVRRIVEEGGTGHDLRGT